MILIQNPLCFLQINILHLLRLPVKARGKIQIIIEHPVLMSVLALLLHPVQHLLGFLFRLFIHSGFPDLRLEATHIRNILRMHLIELLLQKINLLL